MINYGDATEYYVSQPQLFFGYRDEQIDGALSAVKDVSKKILSFEINLDDQRDKIIDLHREFKISDDDIVASRPSWLDDNALKQVRDQVDDHRSSSAEIGKFCILDNYTNLSRKIDNDALALFLALDVFLRFEILSIDSVSDLNPKYLDKRKLILDSVDDCFRAYLPEDFDYDAYRNYESISYEYNGPHDNYEDFMDYFSDYACYHTDYPNEFYKYHQFASRDLAWDFIKEHGGKLDDEFNATS